MKIPIIIALLIIAQTSAKLFKTNLAEQGNDNFSENKSSWNLFGSVNSYMMKKTLTSFGKDTFTAFVDTTLGTSVNSFQSMSDEFCSFQNKDMDGWSFFGDKYTRKEDKNLRLASKPTAEDKKKSIA